MPIKTSLIITTYNWPEALDLVLTSVAKQKTLPDEVIVADDGSGPETVRLAPARADYLILVGGDRVLHPRFLEYRGLR